MVGIDVPRCCRLESKHSAGVVRQGEPTRFQVELGGGPARVNAPIPDEAGNPSVLGLGLGFGLGAECALGFLAPTLLLEILTRAPFRQPEQAGDVVLASPPVVTGERMHDGLVSADEGDRERAVGASMPWTGAQNPVGAAHRAAQQASNAAQIHG
jgi:hypothetical protein